jgi:glycogen debranching enzyme
MGRFDNLSRSTSLLCHVDVNGPSRWLSQIGGGPDVQAVDEQGKYSASCCLLLLRSADTQLWSWDNCLNGLALVQYDIDLAIDQILAPFQHMTQEGRLPDSMTRNELLFDYTKPPVYGWTMFKLLSLLDPQSSQSCPCFTSLTPRRLDEIYRQISRFTGFWFQHRSCSSSAIPYYTHGNDSGWDNSTSYDNQTVCVSPDLGAFLIVECDFLAKLALHLGKDATEWVHRREQLVKGIVDELWDEQRGSFLTLVAAHHLPPNILQRMADNLQPYLSEWGLATERLDSDLYESDGYWRGPIWAPPTIMLESGLRSAGMVELADTVLERFVRLCERNGFAENYDAKNGQGNRDLSYTWSASAYLTLRYEQTRRLGSGKSH